MKLSLKYIINQLLLLLSISVAAQEITEDSVVIDQSNYAILIGTDYGKGIESALGDQSKWEVNLAVSIYDRFRVSAEYGYGMLQPANSIRNGSYQSEGRYFRGGGEYVFTLKPKIYLSMGLMYSLANFSDQGEVNIESELWNSIDEDFTRDDLTANWFEWILNTEAQAFRNSEIFLSNIYWGSRIRLRILSSDIAQSDFDIKAIPGYGKTYSNIVPAINLFVRYRIDF